jgi:hypothetical protein
MDLQSEIDAEYNTRPCGDTRKAARARTMDINEKQREQQ